MLSPNTCHRSSVPFPLDPSPEKNHRFQDALVRLSGQLPHAKSQMFTGVRTGVRVVEVVEKARMVQRKWVRLSGRYGFLTLLSCAGSKMEMRRLERFSGHAHLMDLMQKTRREKAHPSSTSQNVAAQHAIADIEVPPPLSRFTLHSPRPTNSPVTGGRLRRYLAARWKNES
ncbi:MAG: hypothetical protein JWM16_2740 [Verrucomicrobiales bacterium]|nr:hypothetical protein [Verrucomicrobiales bacterium]